MSRKVYIILFSLPKSSDFPEGLSDRIGATYKTQKQAQRRADEIKSNPNQRGYVDAFKDANLWVMREDTETGRLEDC